MEESIPAPSSSSKLPIILGVLVIMLVLILIGIAWYRIGQKQPTVEITSPPTGNLASIEFTSDRDLQEASGDLDQTNLNQIDTTLDQNDTDAAQF